VNVVVTLFWVPSDVTRSSGFTLFQTRLHVTVNLYVNVVVILFFTHVPGLHPRSGFAGFYDDDYVDGYVYVITKDPMPIVH
jgi:hypothetical protein